MEVWYDSTWVDGEVTWLYTDMSRSYEEHST